MMTHQCMENPKGAQQKFLTLMKFTQEKSLIFNYARFEIQQPWIYFYGCMFTAEGINLNPAKNPGIADMPPWTYSNFKAFWAWLTSYSLLGSMSHHTSLPRELQKNYKIFPWMGQLLRPSSGSKPLWLQLSRSLSGIMVIPWPSPYRQMHPAEDFAHVSYKRGNPMFSCSSLS